MTKSSPERLYGALPKDLGLIDLSPTEMMFWLYLPISLPGKNSTAAGCGYSYKLPPNLQQFSKLVHAVLFDDQQRFRRSYVYLTAKTLWVEGGYIGNRPGWHTDGFGSDDVNYIWSDRAPTDFLHLPEPVELSSDCDMSMRQMHTYALRPAMYGGEIVTYPDKHLLRLDPSVIHRSPVNFEAGMRTFVKLSLSEDRYNLVGNSINHDLPLDGPVVPRSSERNHPHQKAA